MQCHGIVLDTPGTTYESLQPRYLVLLKRAAKKKKNSAVGGILLGPTFPVLGGRLLSFPLGTTHQLICKGRAVRRSLQEEKAATGAWVKSKHDMYLIRGSVGALSFIITHPLED